MKPARGVSSYSLLKVLHTVHRDPFLCIVCLIETQNLNQSGLYSLASHLPQPDHTSQRRLVSQHFRYSLQHYFELFSETAKSSSLTLNLHAVGDRCGPIRLSIMPQGVNDKAEGPQRTAKTLQAVLSGGLVHGEFSLTPFESHLSSRIHT
jgi:hypothetical protein